MPEVRPTALTPRKVNDTQLRVGDLVLLVLSLLDPLDRDLDYRMRPRGVLIRDRRSHRSP